MTPPPNPDTAASPPRHTGALSILIPVLVVLFLLNISLGSISIPLMEIVRILAGKEPLEPAWKDIIFDFRLTKALTCILAGGALAVSGLQMQTLFRNALAGPDVLGLSAGASLAVALVFMSHAVGLNFNLAPNPWIVVTAASLGAIAVFMIMVAVARKLTDNVSLLIIGLMIGAAASSLVSVLQYTSNAEALQTYVIWTFGSLGKLGWPEIQVLAVILVAGTIIAFRSAKSLNAWLLGDYYAHNLGINIRATRRLTILSACILTGAVTAFCGPIAFVGLAVPHLVKLIIKTHNHRVLIPAVLTGGAILMLLCDSITRLPGTTQTLPINAITALVGAPVVIYIIIQSRRISQ